jgi:hypothetical protein
MRTDAIYFLEDAMNDEMIERVARAMHKAIDEDTWVGEFEPGKVVVDGNVDFMALARAAIEAMREPAEQTPLARLFTNP